MLRILILFILLISSCLRAESFIHVSFDVTRELFKEINAEFIKENKIQTKIRQSHGGSGKQTSSVVYGLPADVVSLALPYHMDILAERDIVASNWRERFPNNSSPFHTYIAFLVRKGNPKNIADWSDLINRDVKIVPGNPKTSGGAFWNYIAAWIYANQVYEKDAKLVNAYLREFYHNAPILDSTARSAAITFMKRKIGDVLITWANEAEYIVNKLDSNYEVVYPSLTVKIQIPVAVVIKSNKNHQELATNYIKFLFSQKAQDIAKTFFYNLPSKSKVIINAEDYINWKEFKKDHFSENGIFDQIYK